MGRYIYFLKITQLTHKLCDQPCPECPFRSDHRFGLAKQRCQKISDALLNDSWFPCHKTTNSLFVEKPCIGAAIFIENVTGDYRSNVCFRLALRSIKPEDIERTIPVFESQKTFIKGASL